MRIVVHPQRGYYRLFFLEGDALTAVGQVDLVGTTKGYRPKDYLARKPQPARPGPEPHRPVERA